MKSSKAFLGISSLIFSALVYPPLPSLSAGSSISFNCIRNNDQKYSTRVSPQKGKEYNIIFWENQKNPEKTCYEVTAKLQYFANNGRLHYIKYSKQPANGLYIICGLVNKDEECNSRNRIFTLLRGSIPEEVVKGLKEALREKHINNPIYQSSEDTMTVEFQHIIEQLQFKESPINQTKR